MVFRILTVGTLVALAATGIASTAAAQEEPADMETETAQDPGPDPFAEPAPEPEPVPAPPPEPVDTDPAATTMIGENAGAGAQTPPVGKIGIGYFSTSAPLGVRYWMSEKLGFDAGLGFSLDSTTPDVAWGLSAEGGVLFALASTQNLVVFLRGGLGVGLSESGQPAEDLSWNVVVNGLLGGEFFMTALGFPNLSFTAGIGLQADLLEGPDGDFGIRLASAQAPVNLVASAVLGFHIYL